MRRAARPLVVAHRGASAIAPEHTIPAFEAAVHAGADVLALDVHLSADDQLVVIHDADLGRTTDGAGPVRARTLRELKRLDAGRWFGAAFGGQRLQALGEVLERFRDRAAFLITVTAGAEASPGIEERVVQLLQIYDVVDGTLVVAADLAALARCRALDHELRLGLRGPGPPADPTALGPPGLVVAVWVDAARLAEADVAAWRAADVACYAGVVDEPTVARTLAGWGVAGLVTARPDRLRAELDPDA